MIFVNPTGGKIRNDSKGLGHHGAARGYRKHDGADLTAQYNFPAKKGQDILMPVDGVMVRESLPYGNDLKWRGVYIYNPRIEIKMWYFLPDLDLIGQKLKAGSIIGEAQNIGEKYEGVTPHLHLRIVRIDPMLLFSEKEDLEIVI